MIDFTALRAIALAATPGPWTVPPEFHDGSQEYRHDDEQIAIMGPAVDANDEARCFIVGSIYYDGPHLIAQPADTAHIAAFSPSTAIELLDELDRLRAALGEALDLAEDWAPHAIADAPLNLGTLARIDIERLRAVGRTKGTT